MNKREWTTKKILKEIISTLILFFIISTVINYIRKPDISEDIYGYTLQDLKGSSIDFKNYKGKPLIVHFWATWCPTCKLEASNIESLSKEYNVVSIAVNSGSRDLIESFMSEHDLSYTVISDSSGALAKKFNIEAYPTTLIYDKDGVLKFTEVGYSTTVGLKARVEIIN